MSININNFLACLAFLFLGCASSLTALERVPNFDTPVRAACDQTLSNADVDKLNGILVCDRQIDPMVDQKPADELWLVLIYSDEDLTIKLDKQFNARVLGAYFRDQHLIVLVKDRIHSDVALRRIVAHEVLHSLGKQHDEHDLVMKSKLNGMEL